MMNNQMVGCEWGGGLRSFYTIISDSNLQGQYHTHKQQDSGLYEGGGGQVDLEWMMLTEDFGHLLGQITLTTNIKINQWCCTHLSSSTIQWHFFELRSWRVSFLVPITLGSSTIMNCINLLKKVITPLHFFSRKNSVANTSFSIQQIVTKTTSI